MTRGENSILLSTCRENTTKKGMDKSNAEGTRNDEAKKSMGFNT